MLSYISLHDRTRRYWITAIVKFYLYTSAPYYRTKLEDKTTNMIRLECSAVWITVPIPNTSSSIDLWRRRKSLKLIEEEY